MVNYQLGKIYKITTPHTSDIYVGSTACGLLSQRMAKHRQGFKGYKNDNVKYYTSYELLKLGDCKPHLLETYPCNGKDELEAREGYWLQKLRDEGLVCVNKYTPGAFLACGNRKEYSAKQYQDNKEKNKADSAKYRKDNKEKIKKYYQDNKEYKTNYKYWCRTSPIGILARAYFHELNKHNEN